MKQIDYSLENGCAMSVRSIVILFALPFLFSCAYGQKKDKNRYFEVMYMGVDSANNIKFGTYYYATQNNYFASKEEVNKIVIDGYQLKFSYNSPSLSLIITEFKNKDEWMKFNKK